MRRAHAFLVRRILRLTGRGKLTILLYHRVHERQDPLFPSIVDARRFDEQLRWLKGSLRVLPLAEAIEMLRADRLPEAAACVTFDDGYADNAQVALPILLHNRVPATFFVASGFLRGGNMWNDVIIEAIRRAPGPIADLHGLGLGTHRAASTLERRAAIDALIDKLKYREPAERRAIVDRIPDALRVDPAPRLMMTPDEVRSLHRAGMTIGAHTVTHPILTRLDDGDARAEMLSGRAELEAIVAAKVTLFAYPNGRPGSDYDARHVAMARELGFTAALSTRRAAADRLSDFYQLPRFTPWGRTFPRFAAGFARNHLGHYNALNPSSVPRRSQSPSPMPSDGSSA